MPPEEEEPVEGKSIQEIVDELGLYPIDAFDFLQRGLTWSVTRIHGEVTENDPEKDRHISGQQLSEGLREFALMQWGLLARTVLSRWGIHCTMDFGRMVFAMVENGRLQKTDRDSQEDFRNVFDFKAAFERDYKIGTGK